MSISIAAEYVNNNGGHSVTSGAFDVAAGDLIIIVAHADQDEDVSPTAFDAGAITDNQTPNLVYTEIARRDSVEGDAGAVIAWYHKVVSPISGLTITLADNGDNADSPAIKVFTLPAADFDATDPIGAQTEGNWTSSGQQTANITPETDGVGIMVATNWETNACSSVDTDETAFVTSGDISGMSGYVALATGVAKNADMTSATPTGNYLWFEIRAAAAAAAASLIARVNPMAHMLVR